MNVSVENWTRTVHRLGLFDKIFYNRQLGDLGMQPIADGDEAFRHWSTFGVEHRLVPTPLFDPQWYAVTYEAGVQADEFGFRKFMELGLAINQSPTPWFTAGWYQARYNSPKDVSSLQHWLESDSDPLPHLGLQGWLRNFGGEKSQTENPARGRDWLGGLTQATSKRGAGLSPDAFTALAALFDPAFYRGEAGLDPETPDLEAFVDFLNRGLPSGLRPSRLFDADFYLKSAVAAGLPALEPGLAPYEHWLRYGVPARVVPTPMFDSEHYVQLYKDIRESGEWPFLHFVVHGVNEERAISPWFDVRWLRERLPATPDETSTPRRFFASPKAPAPLKELERWAPPDSDGREWLAALTQATLARREILDDCAALASMFWPGYYRQAAKLDRQTSALEAFLHFLTEGLQLGLSPTPLFDAAYYLRAIKDKKLPALNAKEPPLLHWLRHGVETEIVPTPLFDEEAYKRKYPQQAQAAGWLFWRYLSRDVWGGLDPSFVINGARIRKDMPGGESPPLPFFFEFAATRSLSANFGFDAWRDQSGRPLDDSGAPGGIAAALGRISLAFRKPPWREAAVVAELIAAMFDPEAYARDVGASAEASQLQVFAAFLESGAQKYRNACPYFDADFYAKEARELKLPAWKADDNLFLHWLKHGLAANARPSAILSGVAANAADVEEAVRRYLEALTSAEKSPPWFDRKWYANRYKVSANGALRHFLTAGAGKGCLPLPGLQTPWYAAELKRIRSVEERRRRQLDFIGRLAAETNRAVWSDRAWCVQWAAAIFIPEWYVRAAALPANTLPSEAFAHFVGAGAAAGLAATPLFDAEFYRGEATRRKLPALAETDIAFAHWLQYGLRARVIPSPLFDESWYAKEYPEVASSGEWPFFAFAREQIHDSRSPTPLFQVQWYEARYKIGPAAPMRGFAHYLMFGSFQGWLPHPAFEAWTTSFGASKGRPAAGAAPSEGARWLGTLTQAALALPLAARAQVGMAIALFLPEHYKRYADLPENSAAVAAFAHFLSEGMAAGRRPSPLFDGQTYRDQLAALQMPEPGSSESEFAHWLAHGVPARIVPTVLYDENYQLQTYADLKSGRGWAFEHFLIHGVREGRNPNPLFANSWYLDSHSFASRPPRAFYHYLLHGAAAGWRPCVDFGAPPGPADTQETPLERVLKTLRFDRLQTRFESGALAEAIRRLKAIDPTVTRPFGYRRIVAPPYSHALWPVAKRVRRSLPRPDFANVVCIPHCRLSGAARVAGYLTQALEKLFPKEPLLLVRTELSNFERPSWFSSQLHNLDLSAELGDLTGPEKQRVLLDLLIGVEAKRVFNVNSNLAWHLFRDFGDRLSLSADLYAYMFCYDVDLIGEKTGYPINFFETAFPHLKRILVDSNYLQADLTTRHALPPTLASRIARLWTPLDEAMEKMVAQGALHAEKLAKREPGRPWRALWAGRLDRQKRFDIVEAIAAELPELEILAFGASVLGDAKVSAELPPNLKLTEGFDDFASLPLGECDFLLYTSQWDGVPTLLIDAACQGMAVVGSRVWGTADLLSDETAYPVEEVTDPAAYVAAIRALMAEPGAAAARAQELRARAAAHHAPARYLSELSAALSDEG
jgi:glycosyltransferase involved in cell wall biosynthesis